MVTILDDYSRATWTYLTILTSFSKMVSVPFHNNIKTLKPDNGTEFTDTAFQSFLTLHGILHQMSCVYSSEK